MDLAITQFGQFGLGIVEDHMKAELLYADDVFVVAATTNPWSRRRGVKLADLINEPWTLPPPGMDVLYAKAFRAAGLDLPAATVLIGGGIARIALVAEGRFLTLSSQSLLRFAGRDKAINALPINLPDIRVPVGIITLKNRTLTPVAKLFIDCAREVAKPLAKPKSGLAKRRAAIFQRGN